MRNYETKIFEYTEKSTGRKVIKATTMYAGKTVAAYAKCDPEDTFDYEFGKAVALKRLDIKIAQKRMASMQYKVKTCEEIMTFYKTELKKLQNSKANAEIEAGNRAVEIADFETELAEMLAEA